MFYRGKYWEGRICYGLGGTIIAEYVENERELILSQIWVDKHVVKEKIIENIDSLSEAKDEMETIITNHDAQII